MLYRLPIVAAILLLIAACSRPGVTYTNDVTGERIEVRQPPKSIAPATFRRGSLTPSATQPNSASPSPWSLPIEASTGAVQERNPALESQANSLTWAGILLCIAGAAGLVLRAWLPVVPLSACLVAMALGAAFLALPSLLSQPLILWGGLALVGLILGIGWLDNHHKLVGRTASTGGPVSPLPSPSQA